MAKMKVIQRGAKLAGLALGLVSSILPAAANAGGSSQTALVEKAGTIQLQDKLSELIVTSGSASVAVQPDAMRVELGVDVQAKTAAQARAELARKLEGLSRAIEALGEKGLVLQTSLLRLDPVFTEAGPNKPSKLTGYRAQSTLSLTLREVAPNELGEKAARIVDAGVAGGANVVQGISFFLSRPDEAQAQALRQATQDAERNAKTIALSAGVKLGKVHSLEGSPESGSRVFLSDAFEKAATTIEPGEIKITASITARFHFTKE